MYLKRRTLFNIFGLLLVLNTVKAGRLEPEKTITNDTYIGIHANELVRQLLPTGSSNVNNNFNYLVTFIKYKPGHTRGTRMSGNFILNSITDNVNGTLRETNNSIVQYKIGKEKRYNFDSRFSFAYGWDILASLNHSITRNNSTVSGFFTTTRTNNTIATLGTGPGIRLTYSLTPMVLLGTDAGAYLTSTFTQTRVVETVPGQPFDRRFDESKLNYSLGLAPPISLYFIVKIR